MGIDFRGHLWQCLNCLVELFLKGRKSRGPFAFPPFIVSSTCDLGPLGFERPIFFPAIRMSDAWLEKFRVTDAKEIMEADCERVAQAIWLADCKLGPEPDPDLNWEKWLAHDKLHEAIAHTIFRRLN